MPARVEQAEAKNAAGGQGPEILDLALQPHFASRDAAVQELNRVRLGGCDRIGGNVPGGCRDNHVLRERARGVSGNPVPKPGSAGGLRGLEQELRTRKAGVEHSATQSQRTPHTACGAAADGRGSQPAFPLRLLEKPDPRAIRIERSGFFKVVAGDLYHSAGGVRRLFGGEVAGRGGGGEGQNGRGGERGDFKRAFGGGRRHIVLLSPRW